MASGVIIQPYYPHCLNLLEYFSYKCLMTVTVHTHSHPPALLLYSRMSMAVLCMVFTALSFMAVKKFAARLS